LSEPFLPTHNFRPTLTPPGPCLVQACGRPPTGWIETPRVSPSYVGTSAGCRRGICEHRPPDLATTEVIGYEALARFARVGSITPRQCFAEAAALGLLHESKMAAVDLELTHGIDPETVAEDAYDEVSKTRTQGPVRVGRSSRPGYLFGRQESVGDQVSCHLCWRRCLCCNCLGDKPSLASGVPIQ